jgi:hypothetical protein
VKELLLIVLGVVILVCLIRGVKAIFEHLRDKTAARGGWWLLAAGVLAVLAFSMDGVEHFATLSGQKEYQNRLQEEVGPPPSSAPYHDTPFVSKFREQIDRHMEEAFDPYAR